MDLNGVECISLCVDFDQRGWFAEFELVADAQLSVDQDVAITDGDRYFFGHVTRYDPEQSTGLVQAGSVSLIREINPQWADGKLSDIFKRIGVDAQIVGADQSTRVLLPGGRRIDNVNVLCGFLNLDWRILENGIVQIGAQASTEITEDLIYNVDYKTGKATVRGYWPMPISLPGQSRAIVGSCWDLNGDSTTVDLAGDCDLISQLTRVIARETDSVALKLGTITAQSGSTCTVTIAGVSCRNVEIAWGLPGVIPELKLNANVICAQFDGRPVVIAWRSVDVNSWTISGGSDSLALCAPILNWMSACTLAISNLSSKLDNHVHTGNNTTPTAQPQYPVTTPTPIDATIKSIVRSR